MNEEDIVCRLRKRAEIRRQISTRKSVQEGKADRLADLLDEAAAEIDFLRNYSEPVQGCPCGHDGGTSCGAVNCYLIAGLKP